MHTRFLVTDGRSFVHCLFVLCFMFTLRLYPSSPGTLPLSYGFLRAAPLHQVTFLADSDPASASSNLSLFFTNVPGFHFLFSHYLYGNIFCMFYLRFLTQYFISHFPHSLVAL